MASHRFGFHLPCMQGWQGTKIVTYTANVKATEITTVLNHDPRSANWKHLPDQLSDIYKRNQRVTQAERQRKLEHYIRTRMNSRGYIGAFPAVSFGFQFAQPFDQEQDGFGTLTLTGNGLRVVIDGLGRITGCLNVLDQKRPEDANLIEKLYLPVTFFMPTEGAELSVQDLGQLFADFNTLLVKVPTKLATQLDRTNLYVHAAEFMANESVFADHHPALADTKKQSHLQRAARCASEGIRALKIGLGKTLARPILTDETYDSETQSVIGFFAQLAERMGADRWNDQEGLHVSPAGLQALGVIHFQMRHPTMFNLADRSAVLDVLATIDWSRNNPQWQRAGILSADGDSFKVQRDGAELLVKYLSDTCFTRRLPFMSPEAEGEQSQPSAVQ